MHTSLKILSLLFLTIFYQLPAQTVQFANAIMRNAGDNQGLIVVSGETNSSLTQVLDEVNVFRDARLFQLLFFVHTDSGVGLPVFTPFEKRVDVDSLEEGTYNIRCFALNANLIDSTVFFSPDSATFFFPYNDVIPPDSLFVLADTTFSVHYTKTAIATTPKTPDNFHISTFPNPFNARTTFRFSLPSQEFVRLHIFDIRGKMISTLLTSQLGGGDHSVTWNADNFPSGIYFYQINIGSHSHVGRVSLLK